MFGLVVRFTLTEDGASGFDQLVKELVPSIQRDEPGTIVYATHTVEGQHNLRVFYELYRDREAFEELGKLGLVPADLSASMRQMASMRNILVHGYLAVDPGQDP